MKVGDILQREYVDNRSEFELLLYVANELSRKGQTLDFNEVLVDFSTLTDFQILWFDWYVQEGVILSSRSEEFPSFERGRMQTFLTHLDKYEAFRGLDFIEDSGNHFLWSRALVEEKTPEESTKIFSGEYFFQILPWLASRHLVEALNGDEPSKPLVLSLDHMWSDTKDAFLDLLAAQESCSSLKEYFFLDLEGKEEYDIEWDLMCYNSRNNGTFRFYSLEEKREMLQAYGIQEGTVCTLATRSRQSVSNPFGRIQSVAMVVVKKVEEDSVAMSFLPHLCFYTPDELQQDWMKVESEEGREFTKDLLAPNFDNVRTETHLLRNIGFGPYFENEEFLLNPFDSNEMVTRPLNHENVTMTAPELAFILLKTWDVPFNEDVFEENYNLGVSADFRAHLANI